MIFVRSFRKNVSDYDSTHWMCEIRDTSTIGLAHAGNPKSGVSPDLPSISEKLLVNDGNRYGYI